MSLSISSFVEAKRSNLGKNFENVGRITWLGKKRFLVYNPSEGWGYRDLNAFQRLIRYLFGGYKDTHIKKIYAQLLLERERELQQERFCSNIIYFIGHLLRLMPERNLSFPWMLFEKIEFCWARSYDLLEAGYTDVSRKQRELTIRCQKIDPAIADNNKHVVYDRIFQNGPIQDVVCCKKFKIVDEREILNRKLLQGQKVEVVKRSGTFTYPESRGNILQWTANFSDTRLLGLCQGPQLAQSELQVLEHPGLGHLKAALDIQGSMKYLNGNEVMLISGAYRYARLDVTSRASNGANIYGDNFAAASQADVLSKLHLFDCPVRSNIFSFKIPTVPLELIGRACRKDDLAKLLFRAIGAFSAIKFEYPTKKIVVHTGHWEPGEVGNSAKVATIIQLAAARFSGVDQVEYYPLGKGRDFDRGKAIWQRMEREFPDMTVNEFLTYLEDNAARLGFLYE